MHLKTKLLAGLFAVSAALALPISGSAQTYPSKQIRVIIGYGPGGVTDVLNRLVADEAGKRLGQPMVVENRPGAASLVAAQAVKASAPDGYTLLGGSVTGFHPIFMKSALDASKELTPISTFAYGDWFMYVPTSINVNSLRDLAAYAKANPGKMRFAAPATTNTLLFNMVSKRLGITFENIPYKTTDQTIAAMLQGDAAVTFNAVPGFDPHIQAGKLKSIALLSPARSPIRPDVATAKEQGVDVELRFNIGLWGPAGLPNDIVGRLNAAVREALKNPTVAERIRNAALSPTPASPDEMLRDFNKEIGLYREAIADSGYVPQ